MFCHILPDLVVKRPGVWPIFWISHFLKISQYVRQKSLGQSFKNQNFEMNIFFTYSCLKWGHIIWQPYPTGSCIKLAQNMANFHYFSFFENLSICSAKISGTKFQESKFWDEHFLYLSMLKVGTYYLAAISYRIWY